MIFGDLFKIQPLKKFYTKMETKVVHVLTDQYDVYIGRDNYYHGLKQSIWANPFKEGIHGTRSEVIEKYKNWILDQPELMDKILELKGKRLACWCAPRACHGDVLIDLVKQKEFFI
jgi:hypothetical protein